MSIAASVVRGDPATAEKVQETTPWSSTSAKRLFAVGKGHPVHATSVVVAHPAAADKVHVLISCVFLGETHMSVGFQE